MYIFRWLMKNPVIILALYFLSIAAILYSMTRGDSPETNATETAQVLNVDSTEVDLSAAPKIEPSTLTSALVKDDSTTSEATDESAAEETTEGSNQTTTETESADPANSDQAQFGEMSDEELLLMAREAYWNNGLDESAQIYQNLIESNPEVIDYKGELGNVFWRQGFPEKAAELYAEISLPMIAAGDADKVANMVGFIGLFFPEKATEIHNALQANK